MHQYHAAGDVAAAKELTEFFEKSPPLREAVETLLASLQSENDGEDRP